MFFVDTLVSQLALPFSGLLHDGSRDFGAVKLIDDWSGRCGGGCSGGCGGGGDRCCGGGDRWGGGGDGGGSSFGFSAGSLFFRRVGGSDWTTGATPVSFAFARVSMPISKKKSRKEKWHNKKKWHNFSVMP